MKFPFVSWEAELDSNEHIAEAHDDKYKHKRGILHSICNFDVQRTSYLDCFFNSLLSMEAREVLPCAALKDNGPPPVRSVPPPESSLSKAWRLR